MYSSLRARSIALVAGDRQSDIVLHPYKKGPYKGPSLYGASYGDRTHDLRNHNPTL